MLISIKNSFFSNFKSVINNVNDSHELRADKRVVIIITQYAWVAQHPQVSHPSVAVFNDLDYVRSCFPL